MPIARAGMKSSSLALRNAWLIYRFLVWRNIAASPSAIIFRRYVVIIVAAKFDGAAAFSTPFGMLRIGIIWRSS